MNTIQKQAHRKTRTEPAPLGGAQPNALVGEVAPAISTQQPEVHAPQKGDAKTGAKGYGDAPTEHASTKRALGGGVAAQLLAKGADAVKTVTVRGEVYEVLDMKSAAGRRELGNYYKGYAQAFPLEDERMGKDEIKQSAQGNDYNVIFFKKDGKVVGGVQANFLQMEGGGSVGAIEYRWVTPENRGKGLGQELYAAACEFFLGKDAHYLGTIGEFNDKHLMSDEERRADGAAMDPDARLRHHKSVGYKVVDAPYAQPRLSEDSDPVWYLMLGFNPRDRELTELPAKSVLAMIEAYHSKFADIDTDETSKALRKAYEGRDTVKLVETTTPRACIEEQRRLMEQA